MASLTVPDEVTFATFTVVTSTSAFPISFAVFEKANLTVLVDGGALTQSDFSFAGTLLDGGGYQGGTVTLNTPVSGVVVRIERNIAPARASNYSPSASVPVRSIDQALNRQMAVTQDLTRKVEDQTGALSASVDSAAASAAQANLSAVAAAGSASAAATQAGLATTERVAAEAARDAADADAVATAADRVQTGLDRVQTGLDRDAAAGSAADAVAAMTQAELAALAAGAAIYSSVANGEAATINGDLFFVSSAAGVQVYENQSGTGVAIGFLGTVSFPNVAALKAFTGPLTPVGTRIYAGRFRYEVVSSGEHLTTAGSQKLKVLPGEDGFDLEAFGVDLTGVASANTILGVADTAAAAVPCPLVLQNGTISLTSSITVTADLHVKRGGKITFGGGVVLTVEGVFFAGRYEVFIGSVGAAVGPSFASGSVDAIFPEWFGARAYKVSGGTPFDSSPGILKAHQAAARGIIGFTYRILFGQGIYGFASGIDVPAGGECHVRGQGLANTQFRAINGGAGFPTYIYKLVSSTTNSRFSGIYWYGGSSGRPCSYGLYSLEMKHTHVTDCLFSSFNIAAIASSEWDNKFEDNEFEFCHVGIWCRRAGGNNNDITIDTCRFVSCEVPVALNPGTSNRIRNCQFQASLVAPFTKTFIYAQGISGLSIDNNYFETQPTGGFKGMTFTSPETVTVYAAIILNNQPYFTDEVGTVTTTLSQSSSNLGTTGSITDNLFATPAYYQAGSGSFGYTAGAVTFEAVTGTGTGASGTCTVQTVGGVSGIVNSAAPGAGAAGGTKFMIGDIVKIVQGGNDAARATVATTGPNNSIASLYIGHAGAIYPGHVRRLTITGNAFAPSCAILTLYNDRTICDPQKLELRQNTLSPGGIRYQLIGPVTDTVRVRLGDMTVSDAVYDAAPSSGLSRRNYKPDAWAFSAPPTTSVFTRNSGRYKGYPWYLLKLLPGQQVSDVLEFSIPVASSGANNSELIGQPVYLSALKNEGHANTRLRLALEMVNGTDTLVRQNYDTSTSFTKSPGEGVEETSLTVGSAGGTLRGRIQVIAASAGEQEVNFGRVILTIAGVSVDLFNVADFERPLQASASWTPGPVAAGAKAPVLTIPCLGARGGDIVETTDLTFDGGNEMDWRVARKVVPNGVEIHARNVSSITLGGWTNTIRARVHPST